MSTPPVLPEGFSFSLGAGPPELENLSEVLLTIAHAKTFPFLSIKIVEDENETDSVVTLKLPKTFCEHIRKRYLSDEILLFNSPNAQFGIWSYDMIRSFNVLSSLGILNNFENWIRASHVAVDKLILKEKINSKRENADALEIIEELLTTLDLINQVKENTLLFSVARDVINSESMDPDTIIYRLGMAIYHSKNRTGTYPIEGIDDSGELYLKLVNSKIIDKYSGPFSQVLELPHQNQVQVIKVITVFLIAAYVYYNAVR